MLRVLACCGALLLVIPRAAAAELHLTPMIGLTFHGNTNFVDLEDASGHVHRQFGGAVTVFGSGLFGAEAVLVYTPGFFQAGQGLVIDSRSFALMGNAVLTTPRRWTEYGLRPFVSGGLGLLRASATDHDQTFLVGSNLTGYNVGGGAIGFFTQRVGVRFDLRYFSNLHRTEQGPVALGRAHLSYFTGSVGIVFRTRSPG